MMQLRCPGCKQKMLYQPVSKDISNKRKRCVYCGRSFLVKNYIIKKNK
ncbi:hypothetical protein KY339_01940 [Candidatus Woesearchaeota archaeon]|nr:hypothetical protein [Candidatus Woesearchaeota archaeon]